MPEQKLADADLGNFEAVLIFSCQFLHCLFEFECFLLEFWTVTWEWCKNQAKMALSLQR